MKVVAVVQARTGSSRFPGKVLAQLGGQSMVQLIAKRLERAESLNSIWFAIPDSKEDHDLEKHLLGLDQNVFRGDLTDVQKRFVDIGHLQSADVLVRITADCPLVDWNIVDEVVAALIATDVDYASNTAPPTYPDGLDVEAFRFESLVDSRILDESASAKEHVTTALRNFAQFTRSNITAAKDYSHLRWTVDWADDLRQLNERLPNNFESQTFGDLLSNGFTGIISKHERNEGSCMGEGQKLWKRAKEIIPGGSMLFSKKAEVMLPDLWPSYYKKAKGITVTDLDGKEYLDFANMSVGTCSLGYGNEAVDDAVREAISDGVMSSLNSPHEVWLAERLIKLHPWAEMARFARSGGEANAIAVRIARARTGRDKLAVCGYHGWHDWYLSANLNETDNLGTHLMRGLSPLGVPKGLAGTVFPFAYNDLEGLAKILAQGDVAAVKMEVARSAAPKEGFLEGVRELCDRYGSVLIFDECTSGFRETFGGLHLKYGVDPDLAMFGKAMGNGYAITSVIGRADVMRSAEDTFISSTFWTERIGPVAALATLGEMERLKSWESITSRGKSLKLFWKKEFEDLGLDFELRGLDALPDFQLNIENWTEVKTLITQEMLSRNFLAAATVYVSTGHDETAFAKYREAFAETLDIVVAAINEGQVGNQLKSRPIQVGFARLN